MEPIRKATVAEEQLLEMLVKLSLLAVPLDWKTHLMVMPMNDGGMGSLYLFPNGKMTPNRVFGKRVSEYQFKDVDGIDVIASLNTDSEGVLFELDVWKTDYSKLIQLPQKF